MRKCTMKAALIMLMLAVPGFAQEPRVSEEEPSVESEIREWRETYLSTKNESSRERMLLCFNSPDLGPCARVLLLAIRSIQGRM